jgi:hypothetical protein
MASGLSADCIARGSSELTRDVLQSLVRRRPADSNPHSRNQLDCPRCTPCGTCPPIFSPKVRIRPHPRYRLPPFSHCTRHSTAFCKMTTSPSASLRLTSCPEPVVCLGVPRRRGRWSCGGHGPVGMFRSRPIRLGLRGWSPCVWTRRVMVGHRPGSTQRT